MTIDINDLLNKNIHNKLFTKNTIVKTILISFISRILYITRINSFIERHSYLGASQFINELFEELNFSYLISDRDIQKTPAEGRLICVSNHPIGSLDALALLKAFLEIRRDVKIVANEFLFSIEKLNHHFIPFKLDHSSAQKSSVMAISKTLQEENALIIFPAATVSRLKGISIVDSKWNKGAVHFARKMNSPILPVYIEARNSFLFYAMSVISTKISMFLLAYELFNKKNVTIKIHIGEVIPAKAFASSLIEDIQHTKLLRKHVHLIGQHKKGIYSTEKNVIHPSDSKIMKRELNNSQMLGLTRDNMRIYLTSKIDSPESINEIARLREITFRKVGEGTGKKLDLDRFDDHYQHLIVWDEKELEIVGSYRIGAGRKLYSHSNSSGFYTSTLFNFSEEMASNYLSESIELGRSFVQKKYWNSNALNYLWQGIGSYLMHNPSVKYLFGGVSISNSYPISVQEQIVFYFTKWFGSRNSLAVSKKKFVISENNVLEYEAIFTGKSAKEDYKVLKNLIKPAGFTVPMLYKHYSDLCEEGGVKFLDFGVDPDFENCIDGLILVDVNLIRDEKRQKFMINNWNDKLKATA